MTKPVTFLIAIALASIAAAQQLPFTITVGNAVQIPNAPKLQSFASAQAGGKWLLIGGRTEGLHTFRSATPETPSNNFPPQELNDLAWASIRSRSRCGRPNCRTPSARG